MKIDKWATVDGDFHKFVLPELDDSEFSESLISFWILFIKDIIPINSHFRWDHIKFHLEAVEDRFTCFPHTTQQFDPDYFRDPDEILATGWASVGVTNWSTLFKQRCAWNGSDEENQLIHDHLIEKIVDSAMQAKRTVELAPSPLILRFHVYDNPTPLREVTI